MKINEFDYSPDPTNLFANSEIPSETAGRYCVPLAPEPHPDFMLAPSGNGLRMSLGPIWRELPHITLASPNITLEIDLTTHFVHVNGEFVLLRPMQRVILEHLAVNLGTLCTYEEVFSLAWVPISRLHKQQDHRKYTALTSNTHRIRKALGPAAVFLETIPGDGYVLGRGLRCQCLRCQ